MTIQDLNALREALLKAPAVRPVDVSDIGRAVFVGSGDSLASASIAVPRGHVAMSSGDIAWTEKPPAGCDTVVGISLSGGSGASIKSLRLARRAGLRTIAITAEANSLLAQSADIVQIVPRLDFAESVPVAGHLMLAQGVAALCGIDTATTNGDLAAAIGVLRPKIDQCLPWIGPEAPAGMTILSLPELRSAADFWAMKLIEATGVSVRSVPLEESGHVDYFIGPQAHQVYMLVGQRGQSRANRLAEALSSTGQQVHQVGVEDLLPRTDPTGLLGDLVSSVLGTWLAAHAAQQWGRPPFRGGAVNMDAAHITLGPAELAV